MYDETKDETIELTGSLLLAHPHLKDPNFACSVVLMTTHEQAGSLGVVLNQRTGQRLGQLSDTFKDSGLDDVPVYVGGPVNPNQIILAAWKSVPEQGQFQLFFGLEPLMAKSKRLADPELVFRAFKGYSGWGEGQLLGELEDNAWIVADIDAASIEQLDGRDLWRHLIMNVNPELGLLSMGPPDPDAN